MLNSTAAVPNATSCIASFPHPRILLQVSLRQYFILNTTQDNRGTTGLSEFQASVCNHGAQPQYH